MDRKGETIMGKVIATCTSEIKGVQKKNVHQVCLIEDYGIEGDAHAGKWHRQVSLLSYDRIQEFRARGAKVEDGAFGENLVVEGIDFKTLRSGQKFKCNDVVLELTQIGKRVTMDARSSRQWAIASCRARAYLRRCCMAA